jgi:exosortase C (VPDSG-CTERM-specific)
MPAETKPDELNPGSSRCDAAEVMSVDLRLSPGDRTRLLCLAGYCFGLAFFFWSSLLSLGALVSSSQQHSHILLVPIISAYLLFDARRRLPRGYTCSAVGAVSFLLFGLAALFVSSLDPSQLGHLAGALTWRILAFLCFFVAGGFIFLGARWLVAAIFPIAFLLFMVPLPDHVTELLETGSKLASAEAAALLFSLTGTPVLRDSVVFQLPGVVIQVAQECSGIRSSLVLLITSFLAGYLFLKSPWRRAILVGLVIPLGILRNGFRIVVIALLAVHIGPEMIESPIHRQGGPVFFALALIPFLFLLWLLRRGEQPVRRTGKPAPAPAEAVAE